VPVLTAAGDIAAPAGLGCLLWCPAVLCLQLMCVLPAKSVLAALPASLAQLIVLAEAMEEEHSDQQQHSRQQQQQQRLRLQPQQGGHMSKAARKQARKAHKAATAARVEGLQGLDILAALGDDEGSTADHHGFIDGGGTLIGSGKGNDDFATDEDAAAAEGGFGHLLSDDAELSMLRLAKELCGTFPNNVEQLVDLTGVHMCGGGAYHQEAVAPSHTLLACIIGHLSSSRGWRLFEILPMEAFAVG
jgi:hypothetical protein